MDRFIMLHEKGEPFLRMAELLEMNENMATTSGCVKKTIISR
jgi:hypothetical protein